MESIGKDCTELKKKYDECFNSWYSEKFLKNLHSKDEEPCVELFENYKACVMIAIKEKQLEKPLQELRNKKE